MSGHKSDKPDVPVKADPHLPSTEDLYDVDDRHANVPQRNSVDHEDGGLAGMGRSGGLMFTSPTPHSETATPRYELIFPSSRPPSPSALMGGKKQTMIFSSTLSTNLCSLSLFLTSLVCAGPGCM